MALVSRTCGVASLTVDLGCEVTFGRDVDGSALPPIGVRSIQISRRQGTLRASTEGAVELTNVGIGFLRVVEFGRDSRKHKSSRLKQGETRRLSIGDVVQLIEVKRQCSCSMMAPCVCGTQTRGDTLHVLAEWLFDQSPVQRRETVQLVGQCTAAPKNPIHPPPDSQHAPARPELRDPELGRADSLERARTACVMPACQPEVPASSVAPTVVSSHIDHASAMLSELAQLLPPNPSVSAKLEAIASCLTAATNAFHTIPNDGCSCGGNFCSAATSISAEALTGALSEGTCQPAVLMPANAPSAKLPSNVHQPTKVAETMGTDEPSGAQQPTSREDHCVPESRHGQEPVVNALQHPHAAAIATYSLSQSASEWDASDFLESQRRAASEYVSHQHSVDHVVCCDRCNKWRPWPSERPLPSEQSDPWFCEMHPDRRYASCTAPALPIHLGDNYQAAMIPSFSPAGDSQPDRGDQPVQVHPSELPHQGRKRRPKTKPLGRVRPNTSRRTMPSAHDLPDDDSQRPENVAACEREINRPLGDQRSVRAMVSHAALAMTPSDAEADARVDSIDESSEEEWNCLDNHPPHASPSASSGWQYSKRQRVIVLD